MTRFGRGLRNGLLLSVPIWAGIIWALMHWF
jgi:hypothetical protein